MKKEKLSNRAATLIASCKDNELQKISVESVAAKLGVNPSYLSRKFNHDKRMTLNVFITGVKMRRSAQLLVKKRPITPVKLAKKTGFARADYFVVLFKEFFGIHPRDFRESGRRDITDKLF